MSWLRRLSRDRSSKHEQDLPDSQQNSPVEHRAATYRPSTSSGVPAPLQPGRNNRQVSASKDSQFPSDSETRDNSNHNNNTSTNNTTMLRNSAPTAHYDHPGVFLPQGPGNGSGDLHSSPRGGGARGLANGAGERKSAGAAGTATGGGPLSSPSFEPTPDPLQRAFNEALKPFTEQINALKQELESANQTIATLSQENGVLSQQQQALHGWIDKRGLRPDLPLALSSTLPQSSGAASTLHTQLDRKMTMLNYSLHHLADSAPDALPAATVTSTLATLLPSIQHLATLPSGGPGFAFETLIKLAGNLNSHSTGEESDYDRQQIADFYDRIDEAMSSVVGRRFQARAEGFDDWDVGKDIKRLEKTSAFLRKEMGVTNYFIHSIDMLKDGAVGGNANMFSTGGATGQAGAHAHMYDDHGGR